MKIAHSGLVDPTRPAGIEVQVATDPEGRPVAVALVVSHPSGATRIDASLAEWSELGVNLIATAGIVHHAQARAPRSAILRPPPGGVDGSA